MKKSKAVIFDMDGVISDTQKVHSLVDSELAKEFGVNISPEEITENYSGVMARIMFPEIFKKYNRILPDLESLIREKERRIDNLVDSNVFWVDGTKEFIEKLYKIDIPLSVASASHKSFIQSVLSELGISDKFIAIASAKEVLKGKPDPDLFLLAAERMNIDPEDCLVIEDGINGMVAAKKANMQCVALIRNDIRKDYPADIVVSDLRNLNIKELF